MLLVKPKSLKQEEASPRSGGQSGELLPYVFGDSVPVFLFSPHTFVFLKSPHQPLVLLPSSSHSSSCKRGVARSVMALSSPLYLRCCHFIKLLKVLLSVEPVADATVLPPCSPCALPSLGLGHLLHCQHFQASFWAWKSITSASACARHGLGKHRGFTVRTPRVCHSNSAQSSLELSHADEEKIHI